MIDLRFFWRSFPGRAGVSQFPTALVFGLPPLPNEATDDFFPSSPSPPGIFALVSMYYTYVPISAKSAGGRLNLVDLYLTDTERAGLYVCIIQIILSAKIAKPSRRLDWCRASRYDINNHVQTLREHRGTNPYTLVLKQYLLLFYLVV